MLADYEESYVYVKNTTFSQMFGYDGAVFFAHYRSRVVFENCTFSRCTGIQYGLGTAENDASFLIKDSIITGNGALKTAVSGITDSLNVESVFENCIFKDNKIISFDEFLLEIPA